ncbi:hypothetical protein ACHAWF_012064 [Thalassiosira exigua]
MKRVFAVSLLVSLVLVLLLRQSGGEVNTVSLPSNLQCASSQIFDSTGLVCSECNGGACSCPRTSLQAKVECSMESLWQGNCIDISCSAECSLTSKVASLNRQSCIPCDPTAREDPAYYPSQYDAGSNQCSCENSGNGLVTSQLVEIYDSSGMPTRMDCLSCPEKTAVITEDLYEEGQQFFVSAGKTFKADPYSCVSCPDPHMSFGTDYSCVCDDGFILTGEAAIGEQSCIKHTPSVTGTYSKVRFRDPQVIGVESNEASDFALDSLTFSHLYMKAASRCEYYEPSLQSREACQALGNLCVLSQYDEDASPCKQLEAISQRRTESYRNQEEWKHTLPWLYYRDEAGDVINDKGVETRMSFHDILSFKVAKYSLNGTFLGIEDVEDEFEFCFNSVRRPGHARWMKFGNTYAREDECSLNDLFESEMFLYDMYLEDKCSGDSEQSYCLYPVPVLNRNLIRDSKFPNVNNVIEDDLDDVYTRRFFLFDNQSGRTSSGIEAIRYAKKIVLHITTQSEDPTRLVPPILIIDYKTSTGGNWTGIKDELVFKAEYSMETANFWASIQVVIGFIFALAVVIFGVRMNNFQSRSRAGSDGNSLDGSILGLHFMLHAFMIACHTFVLLFFSLTFIVCAYWLLFFKLQNEVFLLLPAEEEFHGATSEYLFFGVSFRLMFWCQTIWISFVLVKQCKSDIFFVDWERPRPAKEGSGVSMWRLVTVANEFNRLQAKRRSSIEFNLLFLALCLIGFHQSKNALPQPSLYLSDNGKENIALAFANVVLFWTLASFIQWLWRFLLYERYLKETPSTKFVDLCTACNISVVIFLESNKGYYLHGRCPYQTADCSVEELLDNLKREGGGHFQDRGLSEATGECQAFEFFASPAFRRQISKIYGYAFPQEGSFSKIPNRNPTDGKKSEKTSLARQELTIFVQSFIDQHSHVQNNGIKYTVRQPWPSERVLGVTPADFRTDVEPKCILLGNGSLDNSFWLSATLLGIEIDLFLHDILTYNAAHMAFNNVGISIFLTYAMHLLRTSLRSWLGQSNLSTKSLIDSKLFY